MSATHVAHLSIAGIDFRLSLNPFDPILLSIENLKSPIVNFPRPLIVDSFAGGGSIPLEALRVGADAFASHLNPVAVLLNKEVLEYIPKDGNVKITMTVDDGSQTEDTVHGQPFTVKINCLAVAVRYWGN